MIDLLLLNLQPITKAVVAIVNLEPLLKSAWFIIMLALLSEYFAEYKDESKNHYFPVKLSTISAGVFLGAPAP